MTPQLAASAVRPWVLGAIKTVHTVAWAFFAGCILAVPILALRGNYKAGVLLIGCVTLECLVLAANRGRCPLTPVAARFTEDRRPNFDIYLPQWLARWNKAVFWWAFRVGPGGTGSSVVFGATSAQLTIQKHEQIALTFARIALDNSPSPCLSLAIGRREC